MFLSIDILFNFVFFIIRLYSHVDKLFILSSSGTKLKKYIETEDLQSMTSSLDYHAQNNIFSKNGSFFKTYTSSKIEYKYYIDIMLVSMSIMAIKLALIYNFLISKFYYIKFFQKQILVSDILADKFIYFKIFYCLASGYVIIFFVSKILIFIKKITIRKNRKELNIYESFLPLGLGENNQQVGVNEMGAYQNILITGSIGSGKTSSAVTNILDSLIKNDIGGLIIDVKGNFIEIVKKVLKKYDRSDRLIEISMNSEIKYNPLGQNISELEMASMVKKVLELLSRGNNSDPFWLDKVEEYIKDFMIISRALKGHVTLDEIHNMTVDSTYLKECTEKLKKYILENRYSDMELFKISSALQTIKNEYSNLDERTISIIKSEITRITNSFVSDYSMHNKFCNSCDEIDFFSNKIIVFSMNFGSHKKMAKVLSTYLKLDFQKQVVANEDKKRVFFICDEYQEFANEEDSHFFSISREYKCINIISMQSYSSLINTLGNEKAANVIIQNLVNKVFFRNDDSLTNSEVIKLLGKEVRKNKSISYSEGGGNLRYNALLNKFRSYKSSLSQSYTISERPEYLIDESYLTRKLKTFEALCFISDGINVKVYNKVKMKRWEENI